MSHDTAYETPVRYSTTFKASELQLKKLYNNQDKNKSRQAKCPCFDGSGGLEALFYVLDYFTQAAKNELELVAPDETLDYHQCFQKFKHVLTEEALSYWTDAILMTYNTKASHTKVNWTLAMKKLKVTFAGGTTARDKILQYLHSNEVRKTLKSTVEQHTRRIIKLMNYADNSQGNSSILTEYERKKILFESFPYGWQANWTNAGKQIATQDITEMIEYFSTQKTHSDKEFHQNKKKNSGKTPHFQKTNFKFKQQHTSFDKNKQKPQYTDRFYNPESKCPIHVKGTHKWKDCRDNKRSPNFIPYQNKNNTTPSRQFSNSTRGRFVPRQQYNNAPNRNQQEHHYQEQGQPREVSYQGDNTSQYSNISGNTSQKKAESHAFEWIGPQQEQGGTGSERSVSMNSNWGAIGTDHSQQHNNSQAGTWHT